MHVTSRPLEYEPTIEDLDDRAQYLYAELRRNIKLTAFLARRRRNVFREIALRLQALEHPARLETTQVAVTPPLN